MIRKHLIIFVVSLMGFVGATQAYSQDLIFKENNRIMVVSLEELRRLANEEVTRYAPFRRKEVTFRGYYLAQLLESRFAYNAKDLRIEAIDGYAVELKDWDRDNWFLVTHEDGEPLTLRNHGPLRLIEVDTADRSPTNLSLYDDWIWMIRSIEVLR
ncbi:hypothetical protein FJM67_09310 [Maribrevibacterium harenarium]|uniref:Oxidoreductase molybdopterin-binding domain-containing protein n=1 Tax=Maribrevibacterium harenarium TaxID=2589817 RepID=A0A501WPA2_9GAMM|nr:hypothetical protein [Maribrevibacterium harenarium]TPE51583.1 hypothetical protein FJM67_09310 [Maribrevibacterium harenarium]